MSVQPLRVFLCHSAGDKPAVRELYWRLAAEEGIQPWLDEERLLPGQDWEREVQKAVEAADVVIACLSSGSTTKRGYVQRELGFALDVAKEQPEGTIFLIPLRLEECNIPSRLRRWHWVDLYAPNGYERLLSALRTRPVTDNAPPVEPPGPAAPPPVQAKAPPQGPHGEKTPFLHHPAVAALVGRCRTALSNRAVRAVLLVVLVVLSVGAVLWAISQSTPPSGGPSSTPSPAADGPTRPSPAAAGPTSPSPAPSPEPPDLSPLVEAAIQRGNELLDAGYLDESDANFADALRIVPNEPRAVAGRAQVVAKRSVQRCEERASVAWKKSDEEALAELRRLAADGECGVLGRSKLADRLINVGYSLVEEKQNPAAAIPKFQEAVDLLEDRRGRVNGLLSNLIESRWYESPDEADLTVIAALDALVVFDSGTQLHWDHLYQRLRGRADRVRVAGDLDQARTLYAHCVEVFNDPDCKNGLTLTDNLIDWQLYAEALERSDVDGAIAVLQRVYDRDRTFEDVNTKLYRHLIDRAKELLWIADFDTAAGLIQQARSIDPRGVEARRLDEAFLSSRHGDGLALDGFERPEVGWLPTESPDLAHYAFAYGSSEYVIQKTDPSWDHSPSAFLHSMFGDTRMSVRARLVGDTAGRYLVIGCRQEPVSESSVRYYRLIVRPDRREFEIQLWDGGAPKQLAAGSWQADGQTAADNWLQIQLICRGEAIEASVNDQLISARDSTLRVGRLWLGMGAPVGATGEARFDTLAVFKQEP